MSVHGWPDGEARPMPYGAVLYEHHGLFNGLINIGALECGAWPSLAVSAHNPSGPMVFVVDYKFIGATMTFVPSKGVPHPGDASTVLIANQANSISGISAVGPAAADVQIVIAGSNIQVVPQAAIGTYRTIAIDDPDPGAELIDIYQAYTGIAGIVHAVDLLCYTGVVASGTQVAVEYLDENDNQLTYASSTEAGAAGDTVRVSFNTSQGGTYSVLNLFGLTESAWEVQRTLPLWRMSGARRVRLNLNAPEADSQCSNIRVLVEEF